jgi:hypothetical protein
MQNWQLLCNLTMNNLGMPSIYYQIASEGTGTTSNINKTGKSSNVYS